MPSNRSHNDYNQSLSNINAHNIQHQNYNVQLGDSENTPLSSCSSNLNLNHQEVQHLGLDMKKSRMPLSSNARKDETYVLLMVMSKYDCSDANNNKSSQVKKWAAILRDFNSLNTHGNFCKQTRTLKSRYEKLVALFLQNDESTLKRLIHEKDVPLLQDIISNNNHSNRATKAESTHNLHKSQHLSHTNANQQGENDEYDYEEEEEEEDLPLDSIKILPRSSYLSKKEADAQAASTESASPTTTNTSHSYMSPNNNPKNSSNKRLSVLYGAAMLEEDSGNHFNSQLSPLSNESNTTNRSLTASRDLELQQLKESIVDIKNNMLNLEKVFDRLNKKVDDLMR